MLRKPPHVLVTTPESLFILLTADRSRKMLRTTRTIVVDEIHAVADDKRGSHLALTLARLDAVIRAEGAGKPQRIGLSATVKPIEEVAALPLARAAAHASPLSTVVASAAAPWNSRSKFPTTSLGAVASGEMWEEIYRTASRAIL